MHVDENCTLTEAPVGSPVTFAAMVVVPYAEIFDALGISETIETLLTPTLKFLIVLNVTSPTNDSAETA